MTRKNDVGERLEAMEGRVAGMEGRVAGVEAATQQRLARLEAAFEALWRRVDKLEDEKKKKKKKGGEVDEEEDDEEDDDDDDEKEEEDDDDDEKEEEDDFDDAEDQEDEDEKKEKKKDKQKSSQTKEENRNKNEETETEETMREGSITLPEGTPPAEYDMATNEGNEPTEFAAEAVSGDIPEVNAGVSLLQWLAQSRCHDVDFSQTSETPDNASIIDSLFPLTPPAVPPQLPPLPLEPLLPRYECVDCGMKCRSGAGLASHTRGAKCPGRANAASPSLSQAQPQKPQPKPKPQPEQPSAQQHQCSDCGLVCGSGAGLAAHMRGSKCPGKPLVPSFSATAATVASSPLSFLSKPSEELQQKSSPSPPQQQKQPKPPQQQQQQPKPPQQQQQQPKPQQQQQELHTCPDCGRNCASGAGLASHRRGNLCTGKPAIVTTSATSSGFRFMSASPKPQQQPPPQQQYKCPDCGRICESGAGLASHRRGSSCPGNTAAPSRHIAISGASLTLDLRPPPQPQHQCPDCGRVCGSGAGLASHMRGSQCPGRARLSDTFSMSSRSSNVLSFGSGYGDDGGWGGGWGGGGGGGGGYVCPNCGRVCASGAGLASHMRGSRCS